MSTAAQIAANRANSQLSTGPTTEAGKSRSSLNAMKTGLTGRTVLLAGDDVELYRRHIETYFKSYNPVGDEETALVQSLADTNWRIYRIPALEAGIYALGHIEFQNLFPEESDGNVRRQLIETQIYLSYNRQLNNLLVQEGRLRRQEEKDRKRLKELQDSRAQQRSRNLAIAAKEYLAALETGKEAEFVAKSQAIGFEFAMEEVKARAEFLSSNAAQARNLQSQTRSGNMSGSAAQRR